MSQILDLEKTKFDNTLIRYDPFNITVKFQNILFRMYFINCMS